MSKFGSSSPFNEVDRRAVQTHKAASRTNPSQGFSASLSIRLWNSFGISYQEFWFKLFQALAKSCIVCVPATTALRSASLNSAGGNTR